MSHTPLRCSLALPYAAMGFAGGWMVADCFRIGAFRLDEGVRPMLAILIPLGAAALGHALTLRTGRLPLVRRLLVASAGALAAAVVLGALVGVLRWSAPGLPDGAASGALCGLAFLPAFALVLAASARVGRARRGSIVDASDRRAVWLAVATSVAVGSIGALPEWSSHYPVDARPAPVVSLWLGLSALVVIAVITVLDLGGWLDARAAARATVTMQPGDPGSPHVITAGSTLDLGLGDLVWHAVTAGAAVYRGADRVRGVIAGCPSRGRGAMRSALIRGVAALALGSAAVAIAASDGFAGWTRAATARAPVTPSASSPSR